MNTSTMSAAIEEVMRNAPISIERGINVGNIKSTKGSDFSAGVGTLWLCY